MATSKINSSSPLLLATDLDGTFAGGSDQARYELYADLTSRPHCTLCYATGRYLESARALQNACHLPVPDLYIADVGATVAAGPQGQTLGFPDDELVARWPGADAVRAFLRPLAPMLEPQRVPSDRRLSYFVRDGYEFAEVLTMVRKALADLDVEIVGSAGTYVDVLPGGVNKGWTLRRVVNWLGVRPDAVVVAGDSLNDLALFEAGFRGIVVGNGEPALRESVGSRSRVYCAQREGAGGVHEGLRHFGFLNGEQ